MNINNQLGLATHPAPKFLKNIDKQLGFIGGDGQAMLFNADGGEYWAKKAQPNTSDDTLLMLNEDRNFLNVIGDNTVIDDKELKSRFNNLRPLLKKDEKWKILTEPTTTMISNAKTYYNGIFKYDEKTSVDVLKSLLEKANKELGQWQNNENNGENSIRYSNLLNSTEINTIKQAGKSKANIRALNQNIIPDLQKAIEKAVVLKEKAELKADTDAFAKAKSSNTIVAYTEYIKNFPTGLSVDKANQAIDEIKKAQKLKELEDAKKNASPEEKKQIDAEIDRLLGVSSGTTGRVATRMFLYGGVALVAIYGLYRVFKGNTASA